MRKITLTLSCFLLAMLAACSSDQKTASNSGTTAAKPAVEAPEYITGRAAFQKLFISARSFAADTKPFRLRSVFVADAPTAEGKAGIWRGDFASPSKREAKAYTWSGVNGENMPERGVSHGTEDTWNPSNSSAQVWELPYLKIDTDKAYEVAQKHGGDKLKTSNRHRCEFRRVRKERTLIVFEFRNARALASAGAYFLAADFDRRSRALRHSAADGPLGRVFK